MAVARGLHTCALIGGKRERETELDGVNAATFGRRVDELGVEFVLVFNYPLQRGDVATFRSEKRDSFVGFLAGKEMIKRSELAKGARIKTCTPRCAEGARGEADGVEECVAREREESKGVLVDKSGDVNEDFEREREDVIESIHSNFISIFSETKTFLDVKDFYNIRTKRCIVIDPSLKTRIDFAFADFFFLFQIAGNILLQGRQDGRSGQGVGGIVMV